MSRQNKANRNNYMQAGRLTPDEMARERQRQGQPGAAERVRNLADDRPAKARGGRESTRRRTPRGE
jgi:hypothetical protein